MAIFRGASSDDATKHRRDPSDMRIKDLVLSAYCRKLLSTMSGQQRSSIYDIAWVTEMDWNPLNGRYEGRLPSK